MIIKENGKFKVITMSELISIFNSYDEAVEFLQSSNEDYKNERD